MDLGDRTAIVTGGAGGIGAAIVEHLRSVGATVHVWDLAAGVDITARRLTSASAARRRGSTGWCRVGSSGEAVYAGSKGGVIAFSKALAREVAASGVRVNCVSPGPTDTPLLGQVAEYSQRLYDGLARAIPMRRIGEPSDIAPAVTFLASDAASYITGQTLSVSGGLTMA